MADRHLRPMLDLIGSVASWKRATDAKTGAPKTFGFAEFFAAKNAALAKALLNDLPLGDSRMQVKIDEKNQKIIDNWLAEYGSELHTDEEKNAIRSQIQTLVDEANLSLGVPTLPSEPTATAESSSTSQTSPSQGDGKPETMAFDATRTESSSDTSSIKHTPVPDNKSTSRMDISHESGTKKLTTAEARKEEERKRDFERKLELMEEDREREQRRLEKNDRLYRSLERDLELDQRERLVEIDRRKRSEEDRRLRRLYDIEQDDLDSDEWRKRILSADRQKARQREREQDEQDREEEEAELRAELRRAEEQHKESVRYQQEEQAWRLKEEAEARRQAEKQEKVNDKKRPAPTPPLHSSSDSLAGLKSPKWSQDQSSPHTIVLGQPGPSRSTTQTPSASTAALSSPARSDSQPQVTLDSSLTRSSSQTSVAPNFAAKIPSDPASLFLSTIRWDLLEKYNLHETKIKPWVTKKIVEYLEVEEPTLIQFICTHIRERKPPKELIAQLKPVFDEETDVFVITLWRMLLIESLKAESELS